MTKLLFIAMSFLSTNAFANYEKCWINGQPVKNANISTQTFQHESRGSKEGQTGHLKCTTWDMPSIDMKYANGKGTGKKWNYRLDGGYSKKPDKNKGYWSVESYKNGVQHGPFQSYDDGKLQTEGNYVDGKEQWKKEYKDGRLSQASVQDLKNERSYRVNFDDQGNYRSIDCHSAFKLMPKIYKSCGFPKKSTVKLFSSGKVYKTLQFYRGEKIYERTLNGPGDDDDTIRRYKNGNLNGTLVYFDKRTKTKIVSKYKDGKKVGTHTTTNEDGKLIKEEKFQKDVLKQLTEYYLNGKKKLQETYKTADEKFVKAFHDNGRVSEKGKLIRCTFRSYYGWKWNRWCPDGVHQSFWENGKKAQVVKFEGRKLSGTQRDYNSEGQLINKTEYKDGYRYSTKRYKDDKLVEHEIFEKDGSRTLHKKY